MCALLTRKPAPFHIVILTLSRVKTLDAHPELSNLIIWKNLLGSIRKLHLAPVQALWWQTWTKQCNIIVDLGLQSEAAKRWPITLLLIQLFGNDSPALASVALTVISSCSVIVRSWVWCSLLQLSREKQPWASRRDCSAALQWCLVTVCCRWGLRLYVWKGFWGNMHELARFTFRKPHMWNAGAFTSVCAGVVQLRRGFLGGLTGSRREGFPLAVVFCLTAQWHIITSCSRQCEQQWPFMLLLSSLHLCSSLYVDACLGLYACRVCTVYSFINFLGSHLLWNPFVGFSSEQFDSLWIFWWLNLTFYTFIFTSHYYTNTAAWIHSCTYKDIFW